MRAQLLLNQNNYARAEESARLALEEDPGDGHALTILALIQSHRGQHKQALATADSAIAVEPDWAHGRFVKACIAFDAGDLKIAEKSAQEALELAPETPATYGLLAGVHLRNKQYKKAVDFARQGLEYDAENETCRNMLVHALAIQGHGVEAEQAATETISDNPESSQAHASAGWVHLRNRKHKEALNSFREALRLEPDNDYARSGLVQAIKAQNFIYAGFLVYMHWMQRLPKGARFGIYFGIWILYRQVAKLGTSSPELLPVTFIAAAAYFLFIYSMWTIDALFNVLLFIHPVGRYALSPYQKKVTVAMLTSLMLGLAMIIATIWIGHSILVVGGICIIGVGVPIAALYHAEKLSNRIIFSAEAIGLTLAILIFVVGAFTQSNTGPLIPLVILAIMLSTWINSALLSRER